MSHGWLVEAPYPHGMVPTSIIYIHKVLRPFICCGWADGSTIMPFQLYLLAKSFGSWQISWTTVRLQIM